MPVVSRRGYCVNHKRTERLMAENGIVAHGSGRRRKLRTTIHGAVPGRDRHGRRDTLRRGAGDDLPPRPRQPTRVQGLPGALHEARHRPVGRPRRIVP